MAEISKAVGQWIVNNVGWTVIIGLFLLSGLFKITKIEVNPIGWIVGWIGKNLTKDVRKDVADLKTETANKLSEIKKDRVCIVDELKADYNNQIKTIKDDLDAFEKNTNGTIIEMKKSTDRNCTMLKKRLDGMEKSNDLQSVRQIRAHVLDFANSCMNKRKHTKMEFENIIAENTQYEAFIKKYKLKNDVYKQDYDFIMKCYHKCQEEGSFLKDPDAEVNA